MTKVRVSPSRIFGECPAGHQMDEEITIDRIVVHVVKGPICYVAMSAFTDQVTQIQRHERVTSHLSCPGCCFDSNQENRVIFVLSSEDAWSLSKKLSKCNWGRIDGRELKPPNTTATCVGSSHKKVTTLKLNKRLIKPSSI